MRTYTVIVVNPLEQCDKDDKPAGMLFQYDYGQRIVFGGVDLPQAYEVHFSNQKMGKSVTVIGDVTGVDIPDAMLLTGQDVHVWLYLHQGESDGETVYYARIAVRQRAKPTHETPTPVQQDEITQAIAALNVAVESTEADAAAAEASADDAGRAQAAAEAAQDRAEAAQGAAESAQTGAETAQDKAEDAQEAAEGARDRAETAAAFLEGCSAEAETLTAGSDATASYSEGVFHFGIPRGSKGSKGDPGDRGPEGPTGPEGPEGPAGYSPTASVSKSGSTATISITDKTGTTTATVSDGEAGAPGQDGYTPVRGTDYWTAADQAAIVADVEADLIDDTAGAGDTTNVWSADKSSSVASGLLSDIDRKAPVIYQTASGDIVSFADGADGMPLSACTVQVNPVQSGTGDPSPENVRPITGRTASNIVRARKNLFCLSDYIAAGWTKQTDVDPQLQDVYGGNKHAFYYMNGKPSEGGTGLLGKLMPLGQVTISFYKYSDNNDRVYFHYVGEDRWVNHSGNIGSVGYKTYTSDASKNCDGVMLYTTQGATASGLIGNLQIEIGAEATEYESPVTTRFPITFPDSAGTVYGGTVDLKAQTLTVDRVSVTITSVTLVDEASTGIKYGSTGAYLSPIAKAEALSNKNISSMYKYRTTAPSESGWFRIVSGTYVFIFDNRFTDLQTANAILASEKPQFVYELATPLVYSLTDLPTILTLPGYNAIWSDTGAVAVTYPADTKTYVDDHTPVQDVQINGTSILSDGVANVPVAGAGVFGVVKSVSDGGILIDANGNVKTNPPGDAVIKAGTEGRRPIVPYSQHISTFYGLAKAAGVDMASSSNPVGTYTDSAKVAIQKMLGVYQAPWELIREDTFTNAEEADHIITVDGNGQSFELTDVIFQFETPKQDTAASKGYYGIVWFYYTSSDSVTTESGAWTQAANANAKGFTAIIRNVDGFMISGATQSAEQGNNAAFRLRYTANFVASGGVLLRDMTFTKINIKSVTGTGHYKLYGKRKWN